MSAPVVVTPGDVTEQDVVGLLLSERVTTEDIVLTLARLKVEAAEKTLDTNWSVYRAHVEAGQISQAVDILQRFVDYDAALDYYERETTGLWRKAKVRSAFRIGDALLLLPMDSKGEMITRIAELTGAGEGTLRNYQTMAAKYPPERRWYDAYLSVYQRLCSEPVEKRFRYLEYADGQSKNGDFPLRPSELKRLLDAENGDLERVEDYEGTGSIPPQDRKTTPAPTRREPPPSEPARPAATVLTREGEPVAEWSDMADDLWLLLNEAVMFFVGKLERHENPVIVQGWGRAFLERGQKLVGVVPATDQVEDEDESHWLKPDDLEPIGDAA